VTAFQGLVGALFGAAWCALALCGCSGQRRGEFDHELARQLHRNAIVVDGHADTTPYFEDPEWRFDALHPASETHVDLPRLRRGGVDVQFWSIYLPRRQGEGRAVREALQRIDAVHRMVERHADQVALSLSVADIRREVAAGKLASLMGLEGGHIIEEQLGVLRSLYRLGVRYMTLTHSFHTSWADSAGTEQPLEPEHGGLTELGAEIVREMNRLGMMVDVSHASDGTFWDALRISRAPLIASHSACRAVRDHPRNLSDDMLRALAASGGLVMINFYSGYIDAQAGAAISAYFARHRKELDEAYATPGLELYHAHARARAIFAADPPPRAPLEALLDHFDHAIRVAGPDHVGLGSDWDGVASMPEQLDDASMLPTLTRGLLERGHSPATVQKVLGENLLRVMAEVERTAASLRAR
jgi:membrane dipeptidase